MGYTHHAWRPAEGTKTGRVWEIADELEARLGRLPRVSEVSSAYAAEGGHPGTGQVQYYAWKNARRGPSPASTSAPVGPPAVGPGGSGWLAVSEDGTIALPADLREAMRLGAPGKVHAEVVDGVLHLSSVSVARDRLREMIRRLDKGTESPVDELIRDRRAEAERE